MVAPAEHVVKPVVLVVPYNRLCGGVIFVVKLIEFKLTNPLLETFNLNNVSRITLYLTVASGDESTVVMTTISPLRRHPE